MARTDGLPNWYLVGPGLEPRTLVSTAGEHLDWVGDFDTEKQWKRYDYNTPEAEGHDRYDPYSTAARSVVMGLLLLLLVVVVVVVVVVMVCSGGGEVDRQGDDGSCNDSGGGVLELVMVVR